MAASDDGESIPRLSQLGLQQEAWKIWTGFPPGRGETLPVPKLAYSGNNKDALLAQGIATPELFVYRPAEPNGIAALILPGGGYWALAINGEGSDVAHRLTQAGVTCFVLVYRLPTEGWLKRATAPLQDAQRAMRVIRLFSEAFRIDPAKLGVLGFSAGGHLAAALATCHSDVLYDTEDNADLLSAKPAFAGLFYPVIELRLPYTNILTAYGLMGDAPTAAEIDALSPAMRVSPDTPPCFLVHAMDDDVVVVENSLVMLTSLRAQGIAAEAHLFQSGGHGFGLPADETSPAGRWPTLLIDWMMRVVSPL